MASSRFTALALASLLCALAPGLVSAGTSTTTVQATILNTQDSYLVQDNVTEKDGTKPELRIKASGGTKNRNLIASINLPSLTGKTVLQAQLKLVMFGASSSTPMNARIYPLTQTWNEIDVCWRERTALSFWTTPGGTIGPYWSDRVLLSDADNGTRVSWQVGPIVNAWLLGDLPNCGFAIKPEGTGSDREVTFRSSEYTNVLTDTPQLTITYTDEPPALRNGFAEIQPTAVRAGATNTPLTLWLDVNSSGSTPSGTATGFDLISLLHEGTLSVTAVTAVTVGGVAIDPSQITWYDNGTSLTVRVPTVAAKAQVRIDFRADVLSAATTSPLELPVLADQTATPGAGAQVLWPGNADGVSGNGDSWDLSVTSLSPDKIDLTPDSLTVVNRTCSQLVLYGQDNLGNQFTLDADSFKVTPALGTMTSGGLFCATTAGTGRIIAFYRSLRDTTRLTVTPALTPVVSSIVLRDARGTSVNALSPADTMLLDASVSDGNGFRDVTSVEYALSFEGHAGDVSSPAYRAFYRWRRGASPAWTLVDPISTSWGILSGLCSVDTTTNNTSPQLVRLAFSPGRITRASDTGQWTASVRVYSSTPLDTTTAARSSIDARVRMQVASSDTAGAFNPGRLGATLLPLRVPTSGKIALSLISNCSYDLKAAVTDLVGVGSPGDTLRVGSPTRRVRWSYASSPSGAALLDTAWTALESAVPAPTSETPAARDLYLWIDHPTSIPPQDYRGRLNLRLESRGPSASPAPAALPLTATIVGAGQSADSAAAEVLPHSVTAGAAQTFTAYLLPVFGSGDTGIDRIQVNVPQGYSTPVVSSVRVDGLASSYTDLSQPGLAEVLLASPVQSSVLIEVRMNVVAPTTASSGGADFVVFYDDAGTPLPPQSATQGDANGLADGNTWHVVVIPGPVSQLSVAPSPAVCFVDSTIAFTATGADAYGNPLVPLCTWSTQGGIGTIATDGRFTATSAGNGLVIGASNGVSDTALVTVRPTRGIAILHVEGPATHYQGQENARHRVRVENLGADSVSVDSLALQFSRSTPGDREGDFVVSPVSGNPVGIRGGGLMWFDYDVTVRPTASPGPVTVDARAYVTEVSSAARFSDLGADTVEITTVTLGGFDLAALQASGSVSPGDSNVALLTLTMTSRYPDTRSLRSLSLTNRTTGAGTQEQLSAELGELTLYRDDGDGVLDPALDTTLLRTVALDGAVNFTPLSAPIAGGDTATFFVVSNLPLEMRDGDVLDLAILDPASVSFAPASFTRNFWPLDPPGFRAVNGMVAEQIGVAAVGPGTLLAGSSRQLALDVTLPANGYEEDQLTRLAVVNRGTADPTSDIDVIEAWIDDGNGVFDPAADRLLGPLLFTGDRWQRTGLAEHVPVGGIRVFVTVGLSDLAIEGRTVLLSIREAPEEGVGMASGNSGPLDREVQNAYPLSISTANRVLASAVSIAPSVVRPGARGVLLLDLLLSNRYAEARTLSRLVVTNQTTGPGGQSALDAEAQSVVLRADGNGNGVLDDALTDPTLGVGFFSAGRAAFSGLNVPLAGGETRHLFVTADVSRTDAADRDILSAALAGPSDLGFVETTALSGSWPVSSGARATVDGLTAEQIVRFDTPAASLGPSEGPALALDWTVPRNGYADDELRAIRLINLGTAASSDIGSVHLWRDGGDGVFTPGSGDDADLGPMVLVGPSWESAPLAETLGPSGARLFAAITASATPADSSTVQLAIPLGGMENASENDGPLDVPVASGRILTISTSALQATLDAGTGSSTVGQPVPVRMIVRNAGSERVTGIIPSALAITGSASFSLVSGPAPTSLSLAPAEQDTFMWTFASTSVGDAQFSGSAAGTGETSGSVRRSVVVLSNTHRVFGSVPTVSVDPVFSMPPSVNRGQTGVVPFSLTFTHPGAAGSSDVRLRSLRIRLEDPSGAGIVPSELLTRIEVAEGTNVHLAKTALETAGSDVLLTLAFPALITPGQPTTLSLRLDLSPSTTAPRFRVVVEDSACFAAEDATSGAPVAVRRQSDSYPIVSATARIVADATDLDLAGVLSPDRHVARGSTGITGLILRAANAGTPGVTSDIRLSSVRVEVCDTTGAPVAEPARYMARIRVRTQGQDVGAYALTPSDGPSLAIALSPGPLVSVAAPVDLEFLCDVSDSARLGVWRLRVGPPSGIDARDANTNDTVRVTYATNPIQGNVMYVEAPVESVAVRSTPLLPSSVPIGDVGVAALCIHVRHPGGPGSARIALDTLLVVCRDETRRTLVPAAYLDRARVYWGGLLVADVAGFPGTPAPAPIPLSSPLLSPGDSALIELDLDFRVSAPSTFFEVAIQAAGVRATDANSGTPLLVFPELGSELPLVSGLAHLDSPPRELIVAFQSLIPATLAPDGRTVPAARLTLTNPAASGSITLDHLVLDASDGDDRTVVLGRSVSRAAAVVNGVPWGWSDSLTADSTRASLRSDSALVVGPGASVDVVLELTTVTPFAAGTFRVGFAQDGIGIVQPPTALLAIQVRAQDGQSFPFWTETATFTPANLKDSYSNFPNPFAAGREDTRFAFYLPEDARVTLRIWTPSGERVATLAEGVARSAGLVQVDRWSGRNGVGNVVRNGVYVAELVAEYGNGKRERVLRKVGVVR